jgi:hypothetical protein
MLYRPVRDVRTLLSFRDRTPKRTNHGTTAPSSSTNFRPRFIMRGLGCIIGKHTETSISNTRDIENYILFVVTQGSKFS